MSSLVICPILGHLAKTLTADDKYYFPSRENLPQQIHMQLSQKQIIFPESFPPFLKSIAIFENFEKKDNSHTLSISGDTECERLGYTND